MKITHECLPDAQVTYPLIAAVGDLDILAQFFPFRLEGNKQVNTFDTYFTMGGMPPILLLVQKLRELISLFNGPTQSFTGVEFLQAMAAVLPNTNKFAANIVDMRTVRMDISPKLHNTKLVTLQCELDSDKLEQMYPSLANLLKHLAEMDISVCDYSDVAEQDLDKAPCMLQLKINYLRGGAIEIKITLMLSSTSQQLVWFSKQTEDMHNPAVFRVVDFQENTCEAETKFLVSIDGSFRIPQLGCAGSIRLPLIICELRCINSKRKFPTGMPSPCDFAPAARFDISIRYMSERRLTAMVLRPFFNLDLLRFILLNHFHIQFEVGPLETHPAVPAQPLKDGIFNSDCEFFDAHSTQEEIELEVGRRHSLPKLQLQQHIPWTITAKIHMFLPIPPRTITSCLSLFVGQQLASPDNIIMLIDLTSALAKDLKEMGARLARLEGDLAAATALERELEEEEQASRHPAAAAVPPSTRQSLAHRALLAWRKLWSKDK